jgi:hypothetical protein
MLVQGSRGGIVPAFDLEELHGTMMMQSPDVVQGQPWRSSSRPPPGTRHIQNHVT